MIERIRAALEELTVDRVYLAGEYASHAYIESVANELRRHHYDVTSRWHTPGVVAWAAQNRAAGNVDRLGLAAKNMEDMDDADGLVLFDAGASTGKFVELGYTLCRSKPIVIMQYTQRRNLFCALADKTIDVSGDEIERRRRLDAILASQVTGYVED